VKTDNKRHTLILTSSALGLLINIVLFSLKLWVGAVSGSVAVNADAFNNLGDFISSLVSLIGLRMSRKKPDREHPFGHGRIEYLAATVVSFFVLWVGIEFFRTSVTNLFTPSDVVFKTYILVLLLLTAAAKLFLGFFYRFISLKTGSAVGRASMLDSFADVFITLITVLSLIVGRVTDFPVDSIAGIIVSVFIVVNAFKMISETLRPILGSQPDTKMLEQIITLVLKDEHVLGVHDPVIHNYGPLKNFASIHAEMPQSMSFLEVHTIFHGIEALVRDKLSIELVIHGDPVDTADPETQILRYALKSILLDIDKSLGYHDLQLIRKDSQTYISFDIAVPYGFTADLGELSDKIKKGIKKLNESYLVSFTVDNI